MRENEQNTIQAIVDATQWTPYGCGSFNSVHLSVGGLKFEGYEHAQQWVVKYPFSRIYLFNLFSDKTRNYFLNHTVDAYFRLSDGIHYWNTESNALTLITNDRQKVALFDDVTKKRDLKLNNKKLTLDELEKITSIIGHAFTSEVLLTLNNAKRAVRKWNGLNPDYPALQIKNGWIAPYLGANLGMNLSSSEEMYSFPSTPNVETLLNDETISYALVDIYRSSRTIIADAYVTTNFLLHDGRVRCIDVDYAFRRGSFDSDAFWNNAYEVDRLKKRWNLESKKGRQQSAVIAKILKYLEECLSENEIKDEYITYDLIKKLQIFHDEDVMITSDIMDTLLKITQLGPKNEVKNKYITPKLVNDLQSLFESGVLVTKDLFLQLIKNQILSESSIEVLIILDALDDIKIICDQDKTLLNQTNQFGLTPLHIAVNNNAGQIVRYLINAQVDLNKKIAPSSENIVECCLKVNMTALEISLSRGTYAITKMLLAANADISPASMCKLYTFVLNKTFRSGFSQVKDILKYVPALYLAPEKSGAILLAAVLSNDIVRVQELINIGIYVNNSIVCGGLSKDLDTRLYEFLFTYQNLTALDAARAKNNEDIVNILLEAQAKTSLAPSSSFQRFQQVIEGFSFRAISPGLGLWPNTRKSSDALSETVNGNTCHN